MRFRLSEILIIGVAVFLAAVATFLTPNDAAIFVVLLVILLGSVGYRSRQGKSDE